MKKESAASVQKAPKKGASAKSQRSGIAKALTGISGFDEATRGGLPRGRATLLFGGPGSGKTVFALQTLVNSAKRHGEAGIFVAFEENASALIENANSFGWGLDTFARNQLRVMDSRLPSEVVRAGAFDLRGLLAGLSLVVREMGAQRIVLDAIDILLAHLQDPAAQRGELYRIHDWLLEHKLTGILTAKAEGAQVSWSPHSSYGFAQYMADCTVLLERRHVDVVSERSLTVLKYRGSDFAENKVPFVIGKAGIEVAEQLSKEAPLPSSTERISTGVPRLDNMVGGGYFRESSVLITGLPGTAKSTLCCAFAAEACARGEQSLFVAFDEHSDETIRNVLSVGIHLRPYVASGILKMVSAVSTTDSAEVHLMRIRNAIFAHQARCVVIDPVSALTNTSDAHTSQGAIARFIHWCKLYGVTLVCTSLVDANNPSAENSPINISTIADVWLHVSYNLQSGERNRALSIIKARGTRHSNQVRELILSDQGISLANVYQAGGEVLMGTLRWERENAMRDAEEREAREREARQQGLQQNLNQLHGAQVQLQSQIAAKEAELANFGMEDAAREAQREKRAKSQLEYRSADPDTSEMTSRAPIPSTSTLKGGKR